jgi:hypothetical protein
MPLNNRNQSPRRRMPMNLEGRYGKIGISAVQAAAPYSSDRKRTHRSIKDAGEAANKERRKPPIPTARSSLSPDGQAGQVI